jgi:hypothetical protein
MKHSELKSLLRKEILNEMGLNEMAKIAGDLETAITKVIDDNPDLDGLALKKKIKGDENVQNALGEDDLYDNQLNKFIDLKKGRREVGTRGRKADPNKPSPEKKEGTGQRGRPKGPEKKKDSKASTFKLSKSYTATDSDEPTDLELRKLARSADPITGSQTQQLRKQEARKMWRAWAREMEKKGIVDSANRILDKAKYEEERAKKAPEIKVAIDKLV